MTSATAASTTIVNQLKPHRSEAAQRLRLNGVSLVALFVVSNLMPLPSLQTALRVFVAAKNSYRDEDEWNLEWWFKWSCLIEATIALTLLYNIFESLYALKYPRQPLANPSSNAQKGKALLVPSPAPKRPYKVLSPFSTPQPQKSFTPTSSFSASTFLSASTLNYPNTPQATPSRVMHYSVAHLGSPNSSFSSVLSSPSPLMSSYRGKSGAGVGKALDSSYLAHVFPKNDDGESDEE